MPWWADFTVARRLNEGQDFDSSVGFEQAQGAVGEWTDGEGGIAKSESGLRMTVYKVLRVTQFRDATS